MYIIVHIRNSRYVPEKWYSTFGYCMRGTLHVSRQMFCPKIKSMTQAYTFVKWTPFSIHTFQQIWDSIENLSATFILWAGSSKSELAKITE